MPSTPGSPGRRESRPGAVPRSRSRLRTAALTAAAVTATLGTYLVVPASPALAATTAGVWLTTPDRANLLSRQGDVSFGSGGSGPAITVDPGTTYQSMVGFGASLTDAAAWNIANSSRRDEIMNALFNPGSGVGLSFLRQPIGASDFSRSFYTYDDGAADPSLSRFSVTHDNAYILPLVKQAKSLNPKLSIMATPWSAPAWMKTSNNLIGGSLNDSRVGVYADYLTKFTQAYQAAGAPIDYLSVQNEPKFSPPGYPGMPMTAGQQTTVINNLAPKLRAAGQNTKILGYDHNWDDTSYAQTVNNGAGANVAGSAWHCYGGNPSGQSTVHNAQPGKDIFFTECSGTQSATASNTFADSLRWQGINLAIGATRNWARTVTTWNMALDAGHGPVIGSCTNCMGVATVNGGSVSYNAEYYVLGHLSKFVQPGAVRISSTGYGDGGIQNVAFRNPDGKIVLVALNSGGTQNFKVSFGGRSFGYSLPGGSMATFTWPGTSAAAARPDQQSAVPAQSSSPTDDGICPGGPFPGPLPSPTLNATKIKDGFNFLEGPTWDAATQTLLLTNMHDGTGPQHVQPSDILRYTPADGTFTTFLAGSGSNGLALSRDGKSVVAATHDQRSVSSYDLATKQRTTLAANYQGHLFNSPNDVTLGADGTVYFTDPDFQRADRPDQMSGRTGVYRISGGVVSLIDDTIREPNGIELSPDGKTLYVGGNATGKVYRYPVNPDGSTGARADFTSLDGTDGGTIDCAGNVYQITYSDGKVHVFSPAGQSLGTISAGANATNVAFGGPDRRTLYITSGVPSGGGDSGNFGLYSVRLDVPGWPY